MISLRSTALVGFTYNLSSYHFVKGKIWGKSLFSSQLQETRSSFVMANILPKSRSDLIGSRRERAIRVIRLVSVHDILLTC